ncbi:unnamed protein product [Heligmosomoides polygyrus]|uniref:Uncharacterized protein n=1 Tax=Heligmosomoides polygyrus TaxID=6339 RepID=A0A183GGV7_HELPZ|nr:unnamed protein product [Heligmosomoides polygyrus]
MMNGRVSDAPFSLGGTNISEYSSCMYLGREVNMANDQAPELNRRKRAAWGAFRTSKKSRRGRRTSDSTPNYPAPLFLLVLTYASET